MRRMLKVAVLAAFVAGCASITRGTDEQVQVTSNPAGAEVRTTMGYQCTTPCVIPVKRKDEFSVTVSKAGYLPQEVPVKTRVAGEGVAAGVLGNAVFGGLIGFAVDASTGATLEHCPNPVTVVLMPAVARSGGPPVAPYDPTATCTAAERSREHVSSSEPVN